MDETSEIGKNPGFRAKVSYNMSRLVLRSYLTGEVILTLKYLFPVPKSMVDMQMILMLQ